MKRWRLLEKKRVYKYYVSFKTYKDGESFLGGGTYIFNHPVRRTNKINDELIAEHGKSVIITSINKL